MKSLKKNYLYSIVYQLLALIIPFLTVPYVSRVLGADQVGVYSFTYSIVYYFMLFAMLGINQYGNREVAKTREDRKKLSKTFSNIYAIQLCSAALMSLFYALYALCFSGEYQPIALIQGLCLLSVFFDYNWFFFGREEFKITVLRNSAVKIFSLIAIFLFVKSSSDLPIYTLILSLSILLSQLLLLPFLKRRVDFVKPQLSEMKRHLKPCLILFIPVISVGLYTIMDKTMLGLMSNMSEVGYYSQAEKIASIPSSLITALSAVMMPRMSNLVAKNDHKQILSYIEKTIIFMSFAAIPAALGLIAIAPNFVPVFLGSGYEKSILILSLLAVPIIFKAIGSVFRAQYMTPHQMDKEYAITTIIGAVVNLGINALLIPSLQSAGAAIGTIFAELAVDIYMAYVLRKALPLRPYFKIALGFLAKGLIMLAVIYPLNWTGLNSYLKIVLAVLIGGLTYLSLNYRLIINYLRSKKWIFR